MSPQSGPLAVTIIDSDNDGDGLVVAVVEHWIVEDGPAQDERLSHIPVHGISGNAVRVQHHCNVVSMSNKILF